MDIKEVTYNLLKSLHIIFFTTWMAGLFYLPRIYVYHSKEKTTSTQYHTFLIMEDKLSKYIMNPSMIFTWILGLTLTIQNDYLASTWLSIKFVLVFFMTVFHIYCLRVKNNFKKKINIKSENFFRIINEIPTILFIFIVFLVVYKPYN